MTNHFGGPCGHCGGTGVDASHASYTTSPELDTSLLDDALKPYPTLQSPVILDLGLLDVYNTPLLPNLSYDPSLPDFSPGFFGDMAVPSEPDAFFASHFSGLQPLSPFDVQGQLLTMSPDFMLPDGDMSTLLLAAVPELHFPSDLDTAWSSTPPEEFLSPVHEPADSPASAASSQSRLFKCEFCPAVFPARPKLNIHTKKHTKPHKCRVAGCGYSAAEKKSLERHVVSRAKWDADHARVLLPGAASEYACRVDPRCTYASCREDNRNRHEKRCPLRGSAPASAGGKVKP